MTTMTATGQTPAQARLDVSQTARIPTSRLIRVEMRKMADTRAGMWLLIAIGAISALVTAGYFIWGSATERGFLSLMSFGGIPLGVLLPVLGILLVTQEWGQRTALVTFTMTPQRGRVLIAKVAAALTFALVGMIIVGIVAAVLTPFGGAAHPFDEVTLGLMLRILVGVELGVIWGLAFGALFLNSAFAIVLYFLVPSIISMIGGIWASLSDNLVWIDLNQSMGHLYSSNMSGEDWAHLATGVSLWIVVPAVIGAWRVLRSEVK